MAQTVPHVLTLTEVLANIGAARQAAFLGWQHFDLFANFLATNNRDGTRANTYHAAVTQSASAAFQVGDSSTGYYTYQFINSGANIVYFAWGIDNTVSATIAPQNAFGNAVPVLPNEIVLYTLPPGAWISVVCDSGKTSDIWITAGEGM
jgi:hypothetical protein